MRSECCLVMMPTFMFMQVPYLLDLATWEFKYVATAVMTQQAVRFLPCGILIFWKDRSDNTWRCDVHAVKDCSRIATFKPQCVPPHTLPAMVFITEARMAIAARSSFEIFQLPTGQSGGVITPPLVQFAEGGASLLTINPPGNKVAFLPAACSDVFLYCSRTLAALGRVHLEGYALAQDRKACGLMWGPYSWVLTDAPRGEGLAKHARGLQVFKQQAGSSNCVEVLRREGQLRQEPACSPDGTFLVSCTPDNANLSVSVHDLRSLGRVVLRQAISLPRSASPASCPQAHACAVEQLRLQAPGQDKLSRKGRWPSHGLGSHHGGAVLTMQFNLRQAAQAYACTWVHDLNKTKAWMLAVLEHAMLDGI